ncbi:TetR/AcrR family transcriptional regulator [Fimbriimonas ginsengisoli]|uniref:Transcription regulator, TetR Family n=1 Tax=Fimbriimonas ginsengisoli Gsoil 348 TaxID=661478 RepID=A0A068NS16_FIMGI|nr:TetR/AcrR family transcriptional regulator [Fimbriimonas ginsengisoli]AIE84409.1 transcription regulator, TetR Family [Fimbriimonas ginsengisoli Gsoil 348]
MNIAETDQGNIRPSMKERQRQLREDAILDAAVEFLQTKGFNAMTLEDITEAIGISRPTLYQHFSSKEDVLIHVAMRNLQRTSQYLQEMDPTRPATDRLREFIAWSIANKFGPDKVTFYDMTRLVLSCGGSDPRLLKPQSAFMKDVEKLIEQAQQEGGVRTDVRAMLLAEVFVGTIKSITFNRLVVEGHTTAAEITAGLTNLIFVKPTS